MARRRRVIKRELLPDPKYGSVLVAKFTNNLMRTGKKSVAEAIFYSALDMIAERTGQDELSVFQKALDNIKPVVEVRPRRVGGSTYQIPIDVPPNRRQALAMRWLIQYSRERGERTMSERLAAEIVAASNGEGNAVRKREDTHRMAESNRAFSHYHW
jgi:small subunit ribosomal protein S7